MPTPQPKRRRLTSGTARLVGVRSVEGMAAVAGEEVGRGAGARGVVGREGGRDWGGWTMFVGRSVRAVSR